MNREKLLAAFQTLLLASLLAVGAAGCLTTAFQMEFTAKMLWWILAGCALFCLCGSVRWGWWIGAAAVALMLGLNWQKWNLPLQLESLVWHISRYYSAAYGWGLVSWSGKPLLGVSRDGILIALGCLIGLITAATVRRSTLPALAASILPLAACVVVTDTVPETKYLFCLLLGLLLLLMTQALRRRNAAQASRLTALLAVPAALALALLFLLNPQADYTPPPEDLPERIVAWFQDVQTNIDLGAFFSDLGVFSDQEEQTVNLQTVGPKSKQHGAVMEVTAVRNGALYLRGQAYDTYDGKSWSKSGGGWLMDRDYLCDVYTGTIHIVTKSAHDVIYTPYNMSAADANRMEQGRIVNSDGVKVYDVEQWEPFYDRSDSVLSSFEISQAFLEQYCQLPENTMAEAQAFLDEHLELVWSEESGSSTAGHASYQTQDFSRKTAEAIANLVRSSASYSLQTPRMPAGEADFAMWFLKESDTGYCVHFATAATVLLRAAGIPARYVTGYLADGAAGKAVTVEAGDAHAWVEYWLPGLGWQVLEATASGGASPVPTSAPTEEATQPQEATVPAGTEPEPAGPQATRPSVPAGIEEDPPETETPLDLTWLWTVLKWVLILAAAAGLILGQYLARLRWRRIRRRRGSPNEQALYRWRETELLCRVMGQSPPQTLWELARKAKFSQHQLSPEELDGFERFRAEAVSRLNTQPWYWQILNRLILALY